jgi:hypothetical protein
MESESYQFRGKKLVKFGTVPSNPTLTNRNFKQLWVITAINEGLSSQKLMLPKHHK